MMWPIREPMRPRRLIVRKRDFQPNWKWRGQGWKSHRKNQWKLNK